jgi:uncharacterized membrane protein YgcG
MEAFKEMQVPRITQKVADGSEELNIGVFNGKLSLTIFSGQGAPPVWKQSLSLDATYLFKKLLRTVLASQPGTKKSFTFTRFDQNTKKSVLDSSLVVGKDDKQVFFLEAQFTANGSPRTLRFLLKSPAGVSTGEDYNDAARSTNRLGVIIEYIDQYLPLAALFTARKAEFQGGGNRGGGGYNKGGNQGGYNKGGNGGGYGGGSKPAEAATFTEDAAMFD